jgi:hypothetical protein
MLAKTQHLFDDATRVTAGDSRWQGRTNDDYWAFVGPFGGATAATILRALIDHPQRAGDPLSVTVNFCAPITEGAFDLDVRLIKANRSTQHWCVELSQGGAEVATLATAVFAERRPSWSHQSAEFPKSPPFEQIQPYPRVAAPWVKQYDFRFIEGDPDFSGAKGDGPASAFSKLWIGDRVPRKIDMLSLMSMSDAFFGRVFHARRELVPFGTVSPRTLRRKTSTAFSPSPTPGSSTKVMGIRRGNSGHRRAACSPPRIKSRTSRLSRIQALLPFQP